MITSISNTTNTNFMIAASIFQLKKYIKRKEVVNLGTVKEGNLGNFWYKSQNKNQQKIVHNP